MSLADDVAPELTDRVEWFEGTVRRIDAGHPVVDLDGGGSVGLVPTSLTVAEGDAVLVAVGRLRTWIVEVQS